MLSRRSTAGVAGLWAVVISGCLAGPAEAPGTPEAPSLSIAIAPLDYASASDVCYSFTVVSGRDELVVGRGAATTIADPARNPAYATWGTTTPYVENAAFANGSPLVCSGQFGNGAGGDWSYVAPCDASPDATDHTVTVWLDAIYVDGQPTPLSAASDYQDPCPTGCALSATCVENADTPLTFNLTIMRRAEQGFFDVAVNLDSIFCSAKLDCREDSDEDGQVTAADEPIRMLHNALNVRDTTVVLGLACSAGPGLDTFIHRTPITITCGPESFTLDPAAPPGNIGPLASSPSGVPLIFQSATFWGTESLPGVNKAYWNVALGVDEAVLATLDDCTLTSSATATAGASTLPGGATPDGAVYPRVRWDVQLSAGGLLSCLSHPLNAGTGVATDYLPETYADFLDGGFDDGSEPLVDSHAPRPVTIMGDQTARIVLWSDGSLTATSPTFFGASPPTPQGYTALAAGSAHTCALRTDGGIDCWGSDQEGRATPPTDTGYSQLVSGTYQSAALRPTGEVVVWGRSANGQQNVPPGSFLEISSYSYGVCGIVAELSGTTTLRCWGHNDQGVRAETPTDSGYTTIVTGRAHGCALKGSGLVTCWGNDDVQSAVPTTAAFKSLARGVSHGHACGILTDDSVLCWGLGTSGQTAAPSGAFKQVGLGTAVSCGIRVDDSMVCWGSGTSVPSPP